MNSIFHTTPIPLIDLLPIGFVASLVLWVEEARKLFVRHLGGKKVKPLIAIDPIEILLSETYSCYQVRVRSCLFDNHLGLIQDRERSGFCKLLAPVNELRQEL